jgi:hypothetical protein
MYMAWEKDLTVFFYSFSSLRDKEKRQNDYNKREKPL